MKKITIKSILVALFTCVFAGNVNAAAEDIKLWADGFSIGPGQVVTVKIYGANLPTDVKATDIAFNLPAGVHVVGATASKKLIKGEDYILNEDVVNMESSFTGSYRKGKTEEGEYKFMIVPPTKQNAFKNGVTTSEGDWILSIDVECDEGVSHQEGAVVFGDDTDIYTISGEGKEGFFVDEIDAQDVYDETITPTVTISDKFTATISASGFCTICPTVGLDVSGVEAYIVTAVEGKTATLTQIKQLSANEGAIIKGDAGTTVQIPLLSTAKTDVSGNMLTGVTKYTLIDNTSGTIFFLSEGKFKKAAASTFLPAGKAYLTASISSAKEFDFIEFDLPGDETSIQGVSENAEQSSVLYNLNGMRVSKAEKGVYIQNGKKYVVK